MNIEFKTATNSELEEILRILKINNLPTLDIVSSSVILYTGKLNGVIVGVIGIEKYQSIALLRSLGVDDGFKKLKIGSSLVVNLFNHSNMDEITDIYLLTETAEGFFRKFDFQQIERSRVPEIIMNTSEFREICPTSATVMYKNIKT